MRRLIGFAPTLSAGLQGTAQVLGGLAVEAGKVTQQPAFRRDFATIMSSNNDALWSFGQAGLSGAEAMVDLGAASAPLMERFGRLAQNSAQAFESWLLGKIYGQDLTGTLQVMADRLGQVWGWVKQTAGGVWDLATALGPLGAVLLAAVANTAQFIGWLAQLSPTMTSIVVGGGLATVALFKLGGALAALQASKAMGGVAQIGGALKTLLLPSALAATGPLTALANSGATVGASLGNATGKITGSATAMASGAAAGARFTSGLASAASKLPLIGLAVVAATAAIDAMTTSTDEATTALAKGGQAAATTRAELADNDKMFDSATNGWDRMGQGVERWINEQLGINPTTAQANAALEAQRATMSNLDRAQSIATQSQGHSSSPCGRSARPARRPWGPCRP